MRKVSRVLAGMILVAVVTAAFLAVFIRFTDASHGTTYDGLGRSLSEPPALARMFLTREALWAGFAWHLLDLVWFFGGFAAAYQLHTWAEGDRSEHTDTQERQ